MKTIPAFSGWGSAVFGAVLHFSQEDELIDSYVFTLMHCLLLRDTHEDLAFVKSPHTFLKYSPLPGPVKKEDRYTKVSRHIVFEKTTSSFLRDFYSF